MSDNRHIEVMRVPTSKPGAFLTVSVFHDNGRYTLSVGYWETEGDRELMHLSKGGCGVMERAPRFSRKRLEQLAEAGREIGNEPMRTIIANVLARNGLTWALNPYQVEMVRASETVPA